MQHSHHYHGAIDIFAVRDRTVLNGPKQQKIDFHMLYRGVVEVGGGDFSLFGMHLTQY